MRPTDSPVIFLQQLGRGLRLQDGKDRLTVVDSIGNHRSFLSKPRTLLGLGMAADPSNRDLLEAIESGEWPLPEGCSVNWSLEAIDLLGELAIQRQRQRPASALIEYLHTHRAEFGERATAMQALRAGFNPSSAKKGHGADPRRDVAGVGGGGGSVGGDQSATRRCRPSAGGGCQD